MNLMALARAYDLATPPANDRAELRQQSRLFLIQTEPLIPIVEAFIPNKMKKQPKAQFVFDALMSVALDIGADSFLSSPLPVLLCDDAPKREVLSALESLPVHHGTLRPELAEQLYRYNLVKKGAPIPSRRHYEARLYSGISHFAVGPVLTPEGKKAFGTSVIHPFFLFR